MIGIFWHVGWLIDKAKKVLVRNVKTISVCKFILNEEAIPFSAVKFLQVLWLFHFVKGPDVYNTIKAKLCLQHGERLRFWLFKTFKRDFE